MTDSGHNPMHEALRRNQSNEAHPDASVLTAFAEGSLLEHERAGLITHLSVCAECRDVLALASTAVDAADEHTLAAVSATTKKSIQGTVWVRWSAAAALLLAMSTAAWLHWAQRQRMPMVARTGTETAPPSRPNAQPEPQNILRPITPKESSVKPATPAEPPAPGSPQKEAAQSAPGPAELQQNDAQEADATRTTARQSDFKPTGQAASHGYVQGAQFATAYANQAPARAMAKASSAIAVRPHWRINVEGQVERAIGDDPWQPVLTADGAKMRVIAVVGADVWAGGEQTRLYHSTDSGTRWTRVVLPLKNGTEHAIAHLRFQDVEIGTVEAEDGTVWITADGGNTWN